MRFDLTSPAGRAAFDRYRRAYARRHGLTMDVIDGFAVAPALLVGLAG